VHYWRNYREPLTLNKRLKLGFLIKFIKGLYIHIIDNKSRAFGTFQDPRSFYDFPCVQLVHVYVLISFTEVWASEFVLFHTAIEGTRCWWWNIWPFNKSLTRTCRRWVEVIYSPRCGVRKVALTLLVVWCSMRHVTFFVKYKIVCILSKAPPTLEIFDCGLVWGW
jgi:hypothetical protein